MSVGYNMEKWWFIYIFLYSEGFNPISGERCLYLHAKDGIWGDDSCNGKRGFICKKSKMVMLHLFIYLFSCCILVTHAHLWVFFGRETVTGSEATLDEMKEKKKPWMKLACVQQMPSLVELTSFVRPLSKRDFPPPSQRGFILLP